MDAETEESEDNETNTTSPVLTDSGIMTCNINKQIRGTNQGNLLLERVVVDLDDPENSTMIIGAYDPNTGYRTGGGQSVPSAYVILEEDEIERLGMDNVTFPFDVLVDMGEDRVLILDPLLSESLFTKLFFLDGRYTTRFEKFSDLSTVTGQRVIVWKVKW